MRHHPQNTNFWQGQVRPIVGNIFSDAIDAVGSVGAGLVDDIESIPGIGDVVKGGLGVLSDFAHTTLGQIVLTALAPEAVSVLWSVPLIGPVVSDVGWCLPGLARGEKLSTAAAEQVTRYVKYAGVDVSDYTDAVDLSSLSPDVAQSVQDFQDACANLEEEARAVGKVAGQLPTDPQSVLDAMGAKFHLTPPVDVNDYVRAYANASGIPNEAAIAGALGGVLGIQLPDPSTIYDPTTHKRVVPTPKEIADAQRAAVTSSAGVSAVIRLGAVQRLAQGASDLAAGNVMGVSQTTARAIRLGSTKQALAPTFATSMITAAIHPDATPTSVNAASALAHDAVLGRPGAMDQLIATGSDVAMTAATVKARLVNRKAWVDYYTKKKG